MSAPISYCYVDLDVISQNVRNVKTYIGDTKLLAVVKADAYGHGIIPVAHAATESGADYIGVSNLEEGVLLRQNGIKTPILLLNLILPEQAEETILFDLTPTVCSFDVVQAINNVSQRLGAKAKIHIKVDTGFGRHGIMPEHVLEFVKIIVSNFCNIYIEGIYTHFSSADKKNVTHRQFDAFVSAVSKLKSEGFTIPIKHVCNSAATLKYPDMHLDMVRVGNLIYGLGSQEMEGIKSPGKVITKITSLKTLPSGHGVGYGQKYRTRKPTEVAVIPFGYYDGLELFILQPNGIFDGIKTLLKQMMFLLGFPLKNRKVKINGTYCNIIGKVGMQNCMVDVTSLKGNVLIGDDAELFPRKINLRQGLPRIYHKEGRSYLDDRFGYETKTPEEDTDSHTGRGSQIG